MSDPEASALRKDVLITAQLQARPVRPRDFEAENRHLVELARLIVENPELLLRRLVESAIELCGAGSAGISVLNDRNSLRWIALAGAYRSFLGQGVPADFSPCGDCLHRGTLELYYKPARVFAYLSQVDPPIVECLVVPLHSPARLVGTLWIMTHDDTSQFTSNDAACLRTLSDFTATALEMLSARQAAEKANRAKDEFLATVSHELRAPISAILGWSEMLLSGRLDVNTAVAALESIHDYAIRETERIEDLIDASRLVNGRFTIAKRPQDMRRIVELAVSAEAPEASRKGLVIEAVIDREAHMVDVDETRVLQAIGNVIANAVKFSPPKGHIAITMDQDAHAVRVVVSDSGEGIEPTLLPHVFDPFRQGTQSRTTRHGGLGLGLAIARHIIELHGGTISLESPGAGGGTTATIELPAGRALAP